MTHKNLLVILIIISFIMSTKLASQNQQLKTFLGKEVLLEKNIASDIKRLYNLGNNFVGVNDTMPGIIRFYNTEGNEISKHLYDSYIYNVAVSNNEKAIVVPYRYHAPGDPYYSFEYRADIFNPSGEVINHIDKLSTPYVEVSENGNYLITTRIDGDEFEGSFEIYDLNSLEKIKMPFSEHYDHFHTAFLSDQKVVCVFHQFVYERKDQNTKKGNSHRSNRTPLPQVKAEKLFLVIFNIVTRQIELNTDIASTNSGFCVTREDKAIYVTPDKNRVLLVGRIKLDGKDISYDSNTLMAINLSAQKLWQKNFSEENDRFVGIKDLRFITDSLFLVSKYGLINSEFVLMEKDNGKKIWNYNLGAHVTTYLDNVMINKDSKELYVQTGRWTNKQPETFKFDLSDGKLMNNIKGYIFSKGLDKKATFYDTNKGTINFMN